MPSAVPADEIDPDVPAESAPKGLLWSELSLIRDYIRRIQTGISLSSQPDLQAKHMRETLEKVDWETKSCYSYQGPDECEGIPPWYFYLSVYRFCIGLLIDGLCLRPTIWELYGWGEWDVPEMFYADINIGSCIPQICTQLEVRSFSMLSRILLLVPIGSDAPPEPIEIESIRGVQKATIQAIRNELVYEELWASKVCCLQEAKKIPVAMG